MAIIDAIPGLYVDVIVEGRTLEEHSPTPDDNDDTDKRVTKYIVAEPGKEFQISVRRDRKLKFGAPKYDIAMWLYIDGKLATSRFFHKDKQDGVFTTQRLLEFVNVDLGKGNWGRRNFMFSDLEFDNTEKVPTSAEQVERAKSMGEIKLILKRGTVGAPKDSSTFAGKDFAITGKVHEKTLKGRAMSRQAGLAETTSIQAPKVNEFAFHDSEPFATFRFLYRSMQDLKSEMIIPRSPSPTPLDEIPDSELTREQLLERLEESRATNARIKAEGQRRIKRERTVGANGEYDDDDDEDGIEVVDPPPKRAKVIESIDLTED